MDDLHTDAGSQVDNNGRHEIGEGNFFVSNGNNGGTENVGADDRLAMFIEIESVQFFRSQFQLKVGHESQYRQQHEAEVPAGDRLKEHERRYLGHVQEKKLLMAFEAGQAGRKREDSVGSVIDLAEEFG